MKDGRYLGQSSRSVNSHVAHSSTQLFISTTSPEAVVRATSAQPDTKHGFFGQNAIAAALGGGIARALAAPLDLIKIRLQLQPHKEKHERLYKSLTQTAREIYTEEGARTFWRGNLPAMMLWMSYSAVQLTTYSFLREFSERYEHAPDAARHMLCGSLAGILATTVTYPMDLMRTLFASQGIPRRYPTLASFVRHAVVTEGVQGLFRGATPAVIQIIPYLGIHFALYESLREHSTVAPWLSAGTCATIAAGTSKILVYPLDTIKKRLQAHHLARDVKYGVVPKYGGAMRCVRDMWRTEGILGFYKGIVPSVMKTAPAAGVMFAVYEAVRLL